MVLDLAGFEVVQSTAKPDGQELGLRVHDKGNTSALFFLFLTPEHPRGSPALCRDAELQQVRKDMGTTFKGVKLNPAGKDDESSASMLITTKSAQLLYGFRGTGDQCASVEVYPDRNTQLNLDEASAFLARQSYNPAYMPIGKDKFIYAEVLFRSQQYKAAAPFYSDFLASLPSSEDHQTERRIATDNMGMALGISGDVAGSRKVFQEASAKDPDYPTYYYNLACADAEEGNAKNARLNLQKAFERKANTLPGEILPDPTKDDSILKLKQDSAFWAFVQTLK